MIVSSTCGGECAPTETFRQTAARTIRYINMIFYEFSIDRGRYKTTLFDMATIVLKPNYDAKLKTLIDDFGQSRESIIEDLIDAEVARRKSGGVAVDSPASAGDDGTIPLKSANPDDLKHTRIVSAAVDGIELYRPKWSSVREEIHLLALKKLGSFAKLKDASEANLRPDKYESDGYKYLPSGRFSLQGVDSNAAWAHTFKLAKHLSVPVKLVVQWRDKPDAAHPGKAGLLEYDPKKLNAG